MYRITSAMLVLALGLSACNVSAPRPAGPPYSSLLIGPYRRRSHISVRWPFRLFLALTVAVIMTDAIVAFVL